MKSRITRKKRKPARYDAHGSNRKVQDEAQKPKRSLLLTFSVRPNGREPERTNADQILSNRTPSLQTDGKYEDELKKRWKNAGQFLNDGGLTITLPQGRWKTIRGKVRSRNDHRTMSASLRFLDTILQSRVPAAVGYPDGHERVQDITIRYFNTLQNYRRCNDESSSRARSLACTANQLSNHSPGVQLFFSVSRTCSRRAVPCLSHRGCTAPAPDTRWKSCRCQSWFVSCLFFSLGRIRNWPSGDLRYGPVFSHLYVSSDDQILRFDDLVATVPEIWPLASLAGMVMAGVPLYGATVALTIGRNRNRVKAHELSSSNPAAFQVQIGGVSAISMIASAIAPRPDLDRTRLGEYNPRTGFWPSPIRS